MGELLARTLAAGFVASFVLVYLMVDRTVRHHDRHYAKPIRQQPIVLDRNGQKETTMKFADLQIKDWFRFEEGGRSYQKTSFSGYYVDKVLGEMQINPEMTVLPIILDTPVAPI